MDEKRREFLSGALLGAAALMGGDLFAEAARAQKRTGGSLTEALDAKVLKFWSEYVRSEVSRTRGANAQHASVEDASRVPEFLFYDNKGGFSEAIALKEKDFPDYLNKGDVKISLRVLAFRPSDNDREAYKNIKSGSLRIDVQQDTPLPSLEERLAWVSVAAMFPDKAGKIPQLPTLKFDPGTTWGKLKTILLTDGRGFWTWNFFVQERESFWSKLAGVLAKASESLVPVLGLPAIAVTALKQFDNVFGYIQAREGNSNWLFQTADLPIVVTKEARQQWLPSAMPLIPGNYVVVPQSHLSSFGNSMNNFEMNRGLVVPRGTKSTNVLPAALETVPDVTYLSIEVGVTKSSS